MSNERPGVCYLGVQSGAVRVTPTSKGDIDMGDRVARGRHRRRVMIPATLAALSLIVPACGDDDDDDASATAEATATEQKMPNKRAGQ